MIIYNIEEIQSRLNLPILKINNYFLHSKYDPIKEAQQFAAKHFKSGHIHFIFGYGKGYFIEQLLTKCTNDELIVVVEPIIKNIKRMHPKLRIIESNEESVVKNEIAKLNTVISHKTVICSPNYDKLCIQEYKMFLEIINNKFKLDTVNETTVRRYSYEWQRNYLFNLNNSRDDAPLSALYNSFEFPVVIASGGPSLTKQLPLLKKVRENVVLIAAGSTVNTLQSNNIKPDFVVSIDGGEPNYQHFKEVYYHDVSLIYSMLHHYKINDSFQSLNYYFLPEHLSTLKQHFDSISDSSITTCFLGMSVANTAFEIAIKLTSGPIALIGQDLAFTDGKTHAEGNKNFKTISEEFKIKQGLFPVKGYYDDIVLTNNSFFSMKDSFEQIKRRYCSDRNIYNCTEGGVYIDGFTNISFKSFIEQFINMDVECLLSSKEKNSEMNDNLIDNLENEIEAFTKAERLIKNNISLLIANKSKTTFSSSTLKKMEKNDGEIDNLLNKTSFSIIADPIRLDVLKNYHPKPNESNEEAYSRVLNQNKELYSRILHAIEITKDLTLQVIKKEE